MRRTLLLAALAAASAMGCANPFSGAAGPQPSFTPPPGPTASQLGVSGPAAPANSSSSWLNPFRTGRETPPIALAAQKVPDNDPTSLNNQPSHINTDVYMQAARLSTQGKNYDEAIRHYESVLQREPRNVEALVTVARLYDRKGDFQGASQRYLAALYAHADNAAIHNDFGMCCARNGKHPLAVSAFTQAVRLEPQKTLYRNNLARALVESGRSQQALQQLLAVHSPDAAHYNFAVLMKGKGGDDQVVFHLRQALRLNPQLTAARRMIEAMQQSSPAGPPIQPATNVQASPAHGPGASYGGPNSNPPQDRAFAPETPFQPRTSQYIHLPPSAPTQSSRYAQPY